MNQNIEEKLLTILDDNGFKFKQNSGNSLVFDTCFFCGKEKKMYVDKTTGVFHCFRCEEKGNAVKLIARLLNISFKKSADMLYGDEEIQDVSIETMKKEIEEAEGKSSNGLILNLSKLRQKSLRNELKLPAPIELTEDYLILNDSNNKAAWNYLIGRGYSPEAIKKLKLYVLPFKNYFDGLKFLQKKYKPKNYDQLTQEEKYQNDEFIKRHSYNIGRIVFPLYVESELYGYVARDYTGTNQRKVMNSTGNFRSNFFWNFDNVKDSPELIICEGTTSAVKAGYTRSIALLGKVMTAGQIKLLKKTKAKKIYFCLDIGTDKEQESLISELNVHYLGQIYLIRLPPVIKLKQEIFPNVLKILDLVEYKIEGNLLTLGYEHRKRLEKELIPSMKKEISQLSIEEQIQLEFLVKKAEYIDAGDYSEEEMEVFKQNAVLYRDIFKK